ncbi:hypothetical protein IT575_09325 [bacterium]|nr:hypothetical protein [bacterium]
MSIWTKIKRVLSLLAVWAVAGYSAWMAYSAWQEFQQRQAELAGAQADYKQQLDDYGRLLAEGDALREDKQYQKDLLKKRFGYTEPDETPIVIVRDNAAGHESSAETSP